MIPLTQRYGCWIGLVFLLALTWISYSPGLSGGFLFDDFINLDSLGNGGPINNWPNFWRYLTSGTADPIGRPLSLLSFLMDARNWPADPAPFLRTNLLLHLINGVLLFSLLRRLGRALGSNDAHSDAAALFAGGMWLVHPLLVSTTLYAVQREAILPTTFILMGLLLYAVGRQRFVDTAGARGTWWMVSGILLGTLLATLCKANGILLPVLAWVLEATVFKQAACIPATEAARNRLRRWHWLLLTLPSLALFAYVGQFLLALDAHSGRSWTIGERLLTEPRILLDYLKLLIVPRSVSSGLYNDDYLVSSGLLQPSATLWALLAITGLIALAFRVRRTAPSVSAALLFFFAGHLLESTAVPLELYFEHRNYLPTLLLFWPLARALCAWRMVRWARIAIAIGTLALLATTTFQRAELWGHPEYLASLWMKQNPESSRAFATVAIQLIDAGEPQKALQLLSPKRHERPDDIQIAVNYVNAACAARGLQRDESSALATSLRRSRDRQDIAFRWLADAVNVADTSQCPGMTLGDVEQWVEATEKNSAFNDNSREQNLQSLFGQIALKRRQPDQALSRFNRALRAQIRPEVAASQSAMLASDGYYSQGLAHLDLYERVRKDAPNPGPGMPWLHALVLARQDYWPGEIALLRNRLLKEIDAQPTHIQAPTPPGGTND